MAGGSWRSHEYVSDWVDDDVLDQLLALPRKLTAEIVAGEGIGVRHMLDLGAGAGSYLSILLEAFPAARGTWVDASDAMEAVARERLAAFADRVSFVTGDVEQLGSLDLPPGQVVVTSRLLHDFSPPLQPGFYRAVHELVEPGGFFFNLDHFAAPPDWEARYRRIRERFTGRRQKPLAAHRDHPLGEIADHLGWLEAAGFERPDVPWRAFFTALVAARRPA
jgi:predicted TPR repeat methyltransferase